MKSFDILTVILLVVGGFNWGLVALFNFDLVATIFGNMTALSKMVYLLVAVSALYQIAGWKAIQRRRSLALVSSQE